MYLHASTTAAVAKGYSDALVRRRSWVRFPSAAPSFLIPIEFECSAMFIYSFEKVGP